MKIRLLFTYLSSISSLFLIFSCGKPQDDEKALQKPINEYKKVVLTQNPYARNYPEPTFENSLYNDDFNLYSDVKAHKRGDIVYIIVYESIDAIQQLATQTGKQNQINAAIGSFFGVNPNTLKNLQVNMQTSSSSKYNGRTQQKGVLSTRLAAYVKEVYPNGNMLIEASRYIYLNDGGHRIILRGIVRPEDIGPDDTVLSSRIANLEIIYDGKGYTVDAGSPGWLARFFAKIWPF